MKNHLTTIALAAAAVLGFSGTSNACETRTHHASHMRHHHHSVAMRHHQMGTRYVIVRESPRTFALTGTPMSCRAEDRPFLERAITWPFRAAYTAVRTPIIVGETLSGRRDFVSDRGLFARNADLDR